MRVKNKSSGDDGHSRASNFPLLLCLFFFALKVDGLCNNLTVSRFTARFSRPIVRFKYSRKMVLLIESYAKWSSDLQICAVLGLSVEFVRFFSNWEESRKGTVAKFSFP